MDLYTREMFEKDYYDKNSHQRLIIRNGEFVGIFKYDKINHKLILTKSLNNRKYGYRKILNVEKEGEYWGSGGSNLESSLIHSNEAHIIPRGYDLRLKEHLLILDKCLGNSHMEVYSRIRRMNPNKNKSECIWI